jgi:predicted nuclease of predicted toxin-antitoxin system
VKFLVDNQLPAALSRHLNSLGHDATHVLEINLAESRDRIIWRRAIDEGRVMVSKDEDFFHLANSSDEGFLVWVRLGNCRTPKLLAAMDRCLPELESAVEAGHRVMEIR